MAIQGPIIRGFGGGSPRRHACRRTARGPLTGLLAGVCVLAFAACASSPPLAAPVPSEGASIEALGDWDDLAAAVSVAVDRVQWAVLSREGSGDAVRWDLMNVRGDPGFLSIERGAGDAVRITARLGRFGDAREEQRLIEAVADRLGELRGVEVAPLGR